MMGRKVAIIGTAGRDKSIPMTKDHWDFMTSTVAAELQPDDEVVSGGAAWADHVAIWAFGTDLVKNIQLHLPAPFLRGRYQGGPGTSGAACNYYHELFSKTMNFDSLDHITQAFRHKNAAITTQAIATGYKAMSIRNMAVARGCTHMLAFTFGEGDVPADGGTKMTWDMAHDKLRIHVPLPRS